MTQLSSLFGHYSNETPGCSVAVLRNSKLLLTESYGLADVKKRIPNTPNTAFRLASLTKPFTAMAILILYEKGQLSLYDSIVKYLPGFPEYGKNITIQHLLSHTSGSPDHEKPLYSITKKDEEPTIYDALKILNREKSSIFYPGERYEYSDAGYVLLALIIEVVSGIKYREFLREYIFNPLNMINTQVVDETKPAINKRASGYKKMNGVYQFFDYDPLNYIVGDEGVYSTVLDLCKWRRAWNSELLVTSSTLRMALTPAILNDGSEGRYGLGWFIMHRNEKKFIFHDGFWVGFNNIMLTDCESDTTVVMLSNTTDFPGERRKLDIAFKIHDLYE